MSVLVISLLVGGAVFLPLLVIALVKFKSPALAVAIALTFSMGATVGLFLSLLAAQALLPPLDANVEMLSLAVFGSAGSIGGAAIALSMLRRAAANQNWERR